MGVLALVRRHGGDLVVVVIAVVAQIEAWTILGGDATGLASRLAVSVAALSWTLPLFFRRRYTLMAPLLVLVDVALVTSLDPDAAKDSVSLIAAVVVAMWSVGLRNERRGAVAGLVIALALAEFVNRNFDSLSPGDILFVVMLVGAPWFAGVVLRGRQERLTLLAARTDRLEREREQRTIEAVAGERARIARELHDIVGHSISVMTIQAGAARLLLDQSPARAEASLLTVEETGRQTLAEMRRLLGVLGDRTGRPALAPQPGLADVTGLVEKVRSAGVPVELEVDGEPHGISPGVDLAGYRIVQEALTNVIRYAEPTRAWVTVRYDDRAVELEIGNDGARNQNGAAGGHGLVGMRERVALLGGTLDAGSDESDGYRVRARLPLGEGR